MRMRSNPLHIPWYGARLEALMRVLSCVLFALVFSLRFVSGAEAQFEPMRDGFGFQNYTNESMPVNLTPVEIWRMFGDGVCSSGSGSGCPLSPQAHQWMERQSTAMAGGHCEGMAVLATRLFDGTSDRSMFGGSVTFAMMLDVPLQREIGYWWATQAVPQVSRATLRGAPSGIVAMVRAAAASGNFPFTIGVTKRNGTGGHAITPYGLVDVDAMNVDILVYDNNFPGEARRVSVNLMTETWSYSAAASPDVPESLYDGNAMTNSLELIPMSARNGVLDCPFCGSFSSGAPGGRTVAATGDASILIVDGAGNRLGHAADGSVVNDISGADVMTTRSADLWNDRSEPSYTLPGGMGFDVYLSDGGYGLADPSILSVEGPGYYLGVEDVVIDVGQEDIISFQADTAYLGYETSGMETPDIVIAAQTASADWAFVVRSRGDTGGQRIEASVDFTTQTLVLRFEGADAESEFDLFAARVDGGTEIEFASDMIVVPNAAVLSVYFGDYDTDGEALAISVDTDGDGVEDDSLAVADTGDMGIGPGTGTTTTPPASGGCSASRGRGTTPMAMVLVGVLLTLVRRRRRR